MKKVFFEAKRLLIALRRDPEKLPPRDDIKVRYKKEDIKESDREDYKDTTFDSDLKKESLD